MKKDIQVCTFYLGDLFFGIEVLKVQEVFRYQEMSRVPLAPPVVRGLINLRGQIITAIDLRRRLKLSELAEDRQPMNIVVRTEEDVVSLLVDAIGDVLTLTEGSYEDPPDTLDPFLLDLVRGVYKLDGKLLLVLDTAKVVRVEKGGATQEERSAWAEETAA